MGRRKGKKGRAVKKAAQAGAGSEPTEIVKAPHTFVIYRGKLGSNVTDLLLDFRKVMEPFTASHIKVQKRNVIKDFVSIAGPLNVTHLMVFTKTKIAIYLRLIRLPRGPTLTFKVNTYSLARDVISSLKRAVVYSTLFSQAPLLVLNGFSGEGMHLKLMVSMFQNMFPSININKVKLNTIRRCVLLNYNQEEKTIDFRHYTIKLAPKGMSKSVKKLIQSKIPNLANYDDVSEFITKPGNLSDSEPEMDGPINQVELPQPVSGRGNMTSQTSAVRLVELGPRVNMQLIKVEEELMTGEVLFHEFVQKTDEEIQMLRKQTEKKKRLKEHRRRQQDINIEKKQKLKEQHKERIKQEKHAR